MDDKFIALADALAVPLEIWEADDKVTQGRYVESQLIEKGWRIVPAQLIVETRKGHRKALAQELLDAIKYETGGYEDGDVVGLIVQRLAEEVDR
jgi:hypothetical protein